MRRFLPFVLAGLVLVTNVGQSTAAPRQVPRSDQYRFRQTFYAEYSRQMAQGGYFDALKVRRDTPLSLRIFDCRGQLCLVAMTIEPKFNDALFLTTLSKDNRVARMTQVRPYGAAVDKAAFIGSSPPARIVIMSRTHMGTPARQLFELSGDTVER